MKINAPGEADIREAAARIRPWIHRTPVLSSEYLNSVSGATLIFKCENFQKAGAFKSRGACNAVFSLSQEQLAHGVATHSSGNHAQALARAAMLRGIKAHVVMPSDSSPVKIAAVNGYGGTVTLCEPNLASRESTLIEVIKNTGATEIHPYDNLTIIAGAATATLELIEDSTHQDYIIAPVGGGGLLSGTALSAFYFSAGTKVIAAEPANADDAYRSFKNKTFVPSVNPDTIADGLRTSLGTLTFPIIMNHVEDIIPVSENNIIEAMKLIWERMKIVVEISAAVGLAAVLKNKETFKSKKIAIILSGGNADLTALPWIK
ncbi:MAG: pyridoxal-phosphate dependent enzyme [Bacteroidota bacterium]